MNAFIPNIMKHCLLVLLIGLTFSNLKAQTNIEGTISSNTIWSASSSPYRITNDLLISPDVTLTI